MPEKPYDDIARKAKAVANCVAAPVDYPAPRPPQAQPAVRLIQEEFCHYYRDYRRLMDYWANGRIIQAGSICRTSFWSRNWTRVNPHFRRI
jgi:hypothetical protein